MNVIVLEGREAIRAQASALEEFAVRCDQPGSMSWLGFFLTGRNAQSKHPYMVVVLKDDADRLHFQAADLLAAALYFEYRPLGLRTGAIATDDASAIRSVVALPGFRTQAAALATEVLLQRGAHIVLTSYQHSPTDHHEFGGLLQRGDVLWARRDRPIRKYLRLESTFEATLARLGKKTRANMRYYRRRLIAKAGCVFVPDARELLTAQDLAAANAGCMNPVPLQECILRFHSSCTLPGGYVCAMRDADGRWLSMVGGWRQGSTTVVQWQINAAGHEKDSLRTVMRSFLLENEVERGAERLVFYGGTTHSMSNAFEHESVRDVIVRRRSLRARLLYGLSRLVATSRSITGRINFLAACLRGEDLQWRTPAFDPRPKTVTLPHPSTPLFADPAPRAKGTRS
jgi:hypothetical protein